MENKLLNKLREDAISLFNVGIEAASPCNLIPNNMLLEENILTISDINGMSKLFDLNNYNRITVIGAGRRVHQWLMKWEKYLLVRLMKGLL